MESLRTSSQFMRLFASMASVQQALPLIEKSAEAKIEGVQPRIEKFVPLETIQAKLMPLLHKQNLGYIQPIGTGATGSPAIITRITWTDGIDVEWIESDAPVSPAKPGFRDYGAFVSYVRRVALLAFFGIVPCGEDPDQGEIEKMRETAPPRASRAARPAHSPEDAKKRIEDILVEVAALPAGTPGDMINSLSVEIGHLGTIDDDELRTRIARTFSEARARLGVAKPDTKKRK